MNCLYSSKTYKTSKTTAKQKPAKSPGNKTITRAYLYKDPGQPHDLQTFNHK